MTISELFALLANIAIALGIPIALIQYLTESKRERLEKEYGAYHALDEKYLDYLHICMEYPRLNLYYLPLDEEVSLSAEERIQQYVLFETLVALMERAFLMYRDQSTKVKRTQWEGWDAYMLDWCKRENFRQLWLKLGHQFETNFVAYMDSIVNPHTEGVANK